MKLFVCGITLLGLALSNAYAQLEATTSNGQRVYLFPDGSWLPADSLPKASYKPITQLEIPFISDSSMYIKHPGFCLLYNEKHEQAQWVAYILTKNRLEKPVATRSNRFAPDPLVKTGSATDTDYTKSGYDRGHLCPAADMAWNINAMNASFYYSNMSPQLPSFNRGIWKKLEEEIRSSAIHFDTLYVVTGPVLQKTLPSIGPNQVSVPQLYYKVVLAYTPISQFAIGFIIPNAASSKSVWTYAVSVDSVEVLTGIDFFERLPDATEALLEQSCIIANWNTKSDNQNPIKPTTNSMSTRCKGVASTTGMPCKNNTKDPSGYCHIHQKQNHSEKKSSNTVQCSATTKSGNRCKRQTTDTSGRCWQHQ